jgi:RNA polymerase sigma-70 factor (ECF subfamily)
LDEVLVKERLYREEGPKLQRALLLFCGDRAVADDAVAEAFVQALSRWDEIRDPRQWIWKAAYRLATKELKQRRRTAGPMPERSYDLDESLVDLVRALQRLTPMQRSAVLLHHYAGFSAREVARLLDSTTGAVFVHLAQGRKRLRGLMRDSDGRR